MAFRFEGTRIIGPRGDSGSLIFNYACLDTARVPQALRTLAVLTEE